MPDIAIPHLQPVSIEIDGDGSDESWGQAVVVDADSPWPDPESRRVGGLGERPLAGILSGWHHRLAIRAGELAGSPPGDLGHPAGTHPGRSTS